MIAIHGKELLDHARDGRALMSSAAYAVMGPAVTALVVATSNRQPAASPSPVLIAMSATFAVVAAFTDAPTLTIDTIAGACERQSLLLPLTNPSTLLITSVVVAATALMLQRDSVFYDA